ncbi:MULTISPECIES: helix-turn-helix domain-containing protein [Aquirufa]|uniref:helix-turn-helix domain-containing protein n=1 Tax=Aquirufa TaxID=2676247 RepID=UPI001CAA7998|nr:MULTISPECIES: helix-turn-helix domain-containing protein [Aquirufa]MBZ1325614.1 helix-turn-helix domain-containing protein [Aquirufa aurantiipilula]MDF0693206.1 helix-turn-helix domain-containing protein [Aquirufa ecclesiirivi]
MKKEQKPMYVIDGEDLDSLLRDIVKSEFAVLEEKLRTPPRILTREEAGQKIGVSKNTISEYIKRGLIPNRGIGHKILVLESDLERIPSKYNRNYYN